MSMPSEPARSGDNEVPDGSEEAGVPAADNATTEPTESDGDDTDAVADHDATEALEAVRRHAAAAVAIVDLTRDFDVRAGRRLQDVASIVSAAQVRWQRDASNFDRIFSKAQNAFTFTARAQKVLDGSMAGALASVGEKFTRGMTGFQSIDTDALLRRLVSASSAESFNAIGAQFERMITRVTSLLPTPAELIRRGLPENLQPVDVVYDPTAFRLWMEEGIPVAYVLDGSIVNDLAAATTPQERRAILGRRRARIVSDCASLLDGITATDVLPYVETGRLAIAGFGAGHHQLAQTWAAANLETLVKQLDNRHWTAIRDAAQAPPKLFRWFFFVTQVRTVMTNVGRGPVPTSFNRQASVHFTTTRRHFSKLNAMLAIAHLTSAICNYDAAAKQATTRRP
ncbi:hypothetical protein KK092_09680 [Curtobacterium flaccumfaciens pv. flaccumfaciens]|uniref:hypothetical protein n=1 Tax=Curtobacterium flaccumfaciens TaxID=2035 RepID=UPI001BDEF555|nr:hypothetical protein [Curtobacterium flaccumfaciens]MBT1669651.1 hypothetical protein [Curtobacterium flaccumfaciens pv. flaccumfaciens]